MKRESTPETSDSDIERTLQLVREGRPVDAEALCRLGAALLGAGRRQEAVALLGRVVAERPDLADACYHLGVGFQELGDLASGLRWLERAVALSPDVGLAQYRLADALWVAGQSARAIGHYQAALEKMPGSVQLLNDLARALHACGLFDGAIAMCARAIALEPASFEAHFQTGKSQLALERFGEAESALHRASEIEPRNFDARFNRGLAAFRAGMASVSASEFQRAIEISPNESAHRNLVFGMPFDPTADASSIAAAARSWAARHADPLRDRIRTHSQARDPERKLKIGYVSPNFWDHCQALFMAPLLAAHDRSRHEIVCYSSVKRPDRVTEMLRARADVWHHVVEQDDLGLADRIRDDRIDVLVDLTMHMASSRLRTFACRPAPVQITWLAYPGTTGLSQIDYRITDRFIDPPASSDREPTEPYLQSSSVYSERSIVLPDTFWCYDPLTSEPPVSSLPALANASITFGCLNNFAKVNTGVLRLWTRVLAAVPQSRLLLRASGAELRRRVLRELGEGGVDASRVELVDTQPRAAYLATYARIDICLDTFPYNGHTTSLDALWMGVPVITRVGRTVVGRAGYCHAQNLGLPELIAHDDDAFVRSAVDLSGDPGRLATLRAGLRERMQRSPLMDAPRFAKNLEAAFRLAWRAWCRDTQAP
jgi:predicted O-linked N-acetylglucosamine transferase (SPINDLY family)